MDRTDPPRPHRLLDDSAGRPDGEEHYDDPFGPRDDLDLGPSRSSGGARQALARPAVSRRMALGLAGSAAGVTAAAVVVGRQSGTAVDTQSLSAGTPAGTPSGAVNMGPVAPGGSGPSARLGTAVGTVQVTGTVSKSPMEYQAAAAGRAPRAAIRKLTQPPTMLPLDPALHLARRATWGLTPTLVRDVKRLGTRRWLEQQLRPARIPDDAVTRMLRSFDTLGMAPQQLRSMNEQREKEDFFYAHTQLENAAILRATWSNRQLYEMVVDFFHSRLHVPGHFDKSRDSLNHYDVNVIRKHAFGRFSDMVQAMIVHPAMITYLDNQNNTKDGGNQNLGRELLELHTLGVDAGYTQADVAGAARLLTGLSVDNETMRMVFRPEQHAVGRVKVFGRTDANASAAGGMATIRALVRDLTRSPRTAHYLALDMARRFVSDAPPETLVKRLAAIYLKNDTAIVPMLRALFLSPEFAVSVGQKYRRPMENVVATMRALGIQPGEDGQKFMKSLGELRYNLDRAGQSPLGRTSPDGFPDFAEPWMSTVGMLARWNNQMSFVGGWRDGFGKPDIDAMLAGATTYGAAVDRLFTRLVFQRPTAAQRAAVLTFLGKSARASLSADARKNDYNLRVRAPALILGGPHHQLR